MVIISLCKLTMQCIECNKELKTKKTYPCKSCQNPICEDCKKNMELRNINNIKKGSYFYTCYTQTCDQCIWFDLG